MTAAKTKSLRPAETVCGRRHQNSDSVFGVFIVFIKHSADFL